MDVKELVSYFDHTILKATATKTDVVKLCEEAKEYDFASVCVNPAWVSLCSKTLKGTNVKVCTVIGFPLGANHSDVKAFETKQAIKEGAQEVDMVINVGALLEGNDNLVLKDIQSVVTAANGTLVKVILETCYLNNEQIVKACELSVQAGADFVKTSTGFGTGGATKEHVALMASTVKGKAKVKASGGIRTLEDTLTMINNGADRIGASAGVAIIKEMQGVVNESHNSGY
ncbi:deoxyribose-phosphate aldolase [Spirochaeta cellobiosiphila]|uniref:deoxyribose-phosphate aldolase n=1 Tax=Spirochaeta cellobiosiphila TaxID=504483 RepID=UPI0004012669|nr:deoxyribose-phosphate aldolase [Spirochaeta cellobiosiphila]